MLKYYKEIRGQFQISSESGMPANFCDSLGYIGCKILVACVLIRVKTIYNSTETENVSPFSIIIQAEICPQIKLKIII